METQTDVCDINMHDLLSLSILVLWVWIGYYRTWENYPKTCCNQMLWWLLSCSLSFPTQAIRVLGLLGALDPYKHKVNIGMIDQSRDASAVSLSESKSSQDSCKPRGNMEPSPAMFRKSLGLDNYEIITYWLASWLNAKPVVSSWIPAGMLLPSVSRDLTSVQVPFQGSAG